MLNKIFLILAITFFSCIQHTIGIPIDTISQENISAYKWAPISGVENILQHENTKDLKKRTIDLCKKAEEHYTNGVNLMHKKDYEAALLKFKEAERRYRPAKLSVHAWNYIHTNQALSLAHTGNNKDNEKAKWHLAQITKKIESEKEWLYNIAIAYNQVGEPAKAADKLGLCIRMDEYYFQAYVTLEAIYRQSGNGTDANKVKERMQKAEAKLLKEKQKGSSKKKSNNRKKDIKPFKTQGKKPIITDLRIIKKADHLQYNKIDKIDERKMIQIQDGIGAYNEGVNSLENKEYSEAQDKLKIADKKLAVGTINPDGLNFTRANLAIAYLSSGDRRSVGKAKRCLKNLTAKLYTSRDWTYNMAVAHYEYGSRMKGTQNIEYIKKSIKLFKLSIKQDKLFLPAYENLIYIYRKSGEEKQAQKIQKDHEKARTELMKSFSKQDQESFGNEPYIFRVNLGTFGEFETPANIYEEEYLISIPFTDNTTSYIGGLFYNLDDAIKYQKQMKERGYINSFIVAFKDGEKLEF